ncbi:8445_t:CDS:10 [Paraglomus occultum]|uniref:8445_t:CDS:1 n=1 Tax=Paraglomus occultum TaxID=144539 RepID=A0A9N8Z0E5_9GLOM|nr:8445_t:CDS:10 [Paraglomus occultum]
MSAGPHTPSDDRPTDARNKSVAADLITAREEEDDESHKFKDDHNGEERQRDRANDEDLFRRRRRSGSNSPSRGRRSSSRSRRSRSPRQTPRRSRSPRTPQGTYPDSYGTTKGRSSYNDPYENDRRERESDRDRVREPHRERNRREHSRSRERSARSFRSDRSYSQRISARETAAFAASQKSQKECRVYVGNLAYEVKWAQLKDFMRQAGEVVFADVLMQPNGMSKGCGVVEYRTPEDARRAIQTLNDTDLLGRPVFIREDRESEAKFGTGLPNRAPDRSGGGGGGGNNNVPSGGNNPGGGGGNAGRQIFVGNLPYSVGWQELKDLFRNAGNIIRADILIGHDRRSKGSGTVLFETPIDAANAISKYDGYEWNGRRIEVREGGDVLESEKNIETVGILLPDFIYPSFSQDRFAGGPPPPRFAGRPRLYNPSYGGGSGGPYYGGGYGSGYMSMSGGPGQYETYGGGYGEFGGSGGMLDYSGGEFGGNYGAPYGAGSGYDGTSGYYGAQGSSSGGVSGTQVYVKNLPYTTTNLDLRELFKHCGNVVRTEILEINGRPRGAGIVQFENYESARLAIEKFNGYTYGGRAIDVVFDRFAQ